MSLTLTRASSKVARIGYEGAGKEASRRGCDADLDDSSDGTTTPAGASSDVVSLITIAVTGAILLVLVLAHVEGVNGPAYWRWPWHSPAWTWPQGAVLYGPAVLTFFAAQLLAQRTWIRLTLLALCAALLIYAAQDIVTADAAIDRAASVLESPTAHGYYTDYLRVAKGNWLERFHEMTPTFNLHSRTKGPGALLFYSLLSAVVDPGRALTRVAAAILGLLSLLGIPLVFALARTLGATGRAAFASASLFAIAPALGAFWPSFDAVYPVVTCLLAIAWHQALVTNRARYSVAFGGLLAVTLLFTYNLLVLGAFFLAYAAVWTVRSSTAGQPWYRSLGRPLRHALTAMAVLVLLYGAFYVTSGFDPIATFGSALGNQSDLLNEIPRPYPATAVFDLTDLALGMAWLPVLPAAVAARAAVKDLRGARSQLVLLCLFPPVLVALLALLPGETARVMLFMVPLVLVAAGLEVSRWGEATRLVLYAATIALSIAVVRTMIFVIP